MAIAKFQKVVSLFKTTLAQRITDSATSVTLSDVPGGVMQYPAWMVIEPLGENVEMIYLPSSPSSTTYSSVVRGLDPESDNDTNAGFEHDHPAGVDVIISPVHRNWNELVKVMDGDAATGATTLRVGDETDSNITVYAQNADGNKPYLQYNATSNKWLISNDGTSTYDISAGGSGLTRGPGVDVVASAITLDVRASGGIRNNQGTGSAQCDVDPAIVARLDTANTWTEVQSFTANNAQITTDADSANDAVRKSFMDAEIVKGAILATSGEAISVGHGVYVKNSDGKYYKTLGTGDEPTYSYRGVALTATTGADESFAFAPPGHTVTTSGLTPGPYYISDTAGVLTTTPGTREARVGWADSATRLIVERPRFVRRGSFTVSSTGNTTVITGFYPAHIILRGAVNSAGVRFGQMSVGDDSNSCVRSALTGTAGTGVDTLDESNAVSCFAPAGPTGLLLGTVSAKSATGFTFNTNTYSTDGGNYSSHTVQWAAFSD